VPDLLLDWLAELFKKLYSVVNELIFSLIESRYIFVDVVMVEDSRPFLHFICKVLIYL